MLPMACETATVSHGEEAPTLVLSSHHKDKSKIVEIELGSEEEDTIMVSPSKQRVSAVVPGGLAAAESSQEEMMTSSQDDGNYSTDDSTTATARLRFKDFASISKMPSPQKRKASYKRSARGERIARREQQNTVLNVRVFDYDIKYKMSGTSVLFQTDCIVPLVEKLIPTKSSLSDLKAGSKVINTKSMASNKFMTREFVSWNSLRLLINDGLFDQSLRDMLNSYEPFRRNDAASSASAVGCTLGKSLEKDHISVVGVDITFLVSKGKIYFDILGSFTILGELKMAMRHRWEPADAILQEHGLSQKEAFRRSHKTGRKPSVCSSTLTSQRSHISLRALLCLVENGLVKNDERKETLQKLFQHIEQEVFTIGEKKQRLYDELQYTVDMLLGFRKRDPSSSQEDEKPYSADVSTDDAGGCTDHNGSNGTELCDGSCGRTYHFTTRCCDKDHTVQLGDRDIGYIVRNDQLFLDKCNAFSALGRMYVIRCSDYRKPDKMLNGSGMRAKEHYLYEKRNYVADAPRNRRTHISLEAFIVLVHKGFADSAKNEMLLEAVGKVITLIPKLKQNCSNYGPNLNESASDANVSSIEVKAESCEEQREGEKEPKKEEERIGEQIAELQDNKIKILGREVCSRTEHGKLYLHLQAITEFLADEDRLIPRLKRLARSLDIKHPFFPSYFKKNAKQYISLECIMALVERGQVEPMQKDGLTSELEALAKEQPKKSDTEENVETEKTDYTEEDSDDEEEEQEEQSASGEKPLIEVLGQMVPFQVVNSFVYLEKKAMFQICSISCGPHYRTYRAIDRLLEQAQVCLDDAFLYESRRRGYISTEALRVLADTKFISDEKRRTELVERLNELENDKESLRTNRTLALKSFGNVAFKMHQNSVYLNTIQVLRAVGFSPAYLDHSRSKIYFVICKLLTNRGQNQNSCFLKVGKSKYVFISLHALLFLFETEFGPFKEKAKVAKIREEILGSLAEQGFAQKELRKRRRETENEDVKSEGFGKCIKLGSEFPPIRYKLRDGELFVHRKTCFEAIELEKAIMTSSRGYGPINDILQRSGMDIARCYLTGKRERFNYISLVALITLLESQDSLVICLEKKEKFSEALMAAIQVGVAHCIKFQEKDDEANQPVKKLHLHGMPECAVPFKLQNRRLYLSRHVSYAMSGLYDKAGQNHGDYDIFEDPVSPLSDRGMNAADCFLADGGDSYAFISVDALLILMNLDGDISRAADYNKLLWKNLLAAVAMEAPKLKVHVKMTEFRSNLLDTLLKKYVFALEHRREIREQGDEFVEFVDLVTEAETEEDIADIFGESTSAKKRPRLSVSSSECSSLQRHRSNTLTSLPESMVAEELAPGEEEYLQKLLQQGIAMENRAESTRSSHGSRSGHNSESSRTCSSSSSDEERPCEVITQEVFAEMKSNLEANQQSGQIGDWQVKNCDDSMIRLVVAPGYGASRKMSFINPDVSGVLCYDFAIQPLAAPQLLINSLAVSPSFIYGIVEKALSKGILNLLYHLLILRPCFGYFSPELVETVERGGPVMAGSSKDQMWNDVYVDKVFVGSSRNGRTFAGTVRSKKCSVLARSRVGDTCGECEALKKLVINRSVLASSSSEEASPDDPGSTPRLGKDGESLAHQKSVWQVKESSQQGCTFVCPQHQSFNASLPQQFSGTNQATSIVEHKVEISHDLKAKLYLNHKNIQKTFDEFERNKQVGPLLEWVASLRVCIGYPDASLVEQARYLNEKKHVLQPEIRKFFQHVLVDEDFKGHMTIDGSAFQGTVRTPTCRYVAGEQADVCDQCRLLQEPIEFLGL